MSENKLKIKTLPSETDPNIIVPVVSPKAVQGTFPKILEKDTTNANLDEFLTDLKSYLEGLGTTISNVIDSEFNKRFPASEETGISWEQTLQNQCNDLKTRVGQIEDTMLPVGMIIKSYDFEHYPDGSAIEWVNDEFNLSDTPSGWELVETQEVLTCFKTIVRTTSYQTDAENICTIEEMWNFFKEKYSDFEAPTFGDVDSYKIIDGKVKKIQEDIQSRLFGTVVNGDANPKSTGRQHHMESLHYLPQGDSHLVYVVWQMYNDGKISPMRFNVTFNTLRPCFVWRKVG